MNSLTTLILITVLATFSACATKVVHNDTGFRNVDEKLIKLAGKTKPTNTMLSTLYKNKVSERILPESGAYFRCNGSKVLTAEINWTITLGQGNQLTGTKSKIDSCGNTSNWDVAGRYDNNYLYIYNIGNKKKYIYAYKIEQKGRILKQTNKIFLRDGAEKRLPLRQNGDVYDNSKYSMTYYISQVDRSLNHPQNTNASLSEKLTELKMLLNKGFIEQEEYDAKKKSLLDSF